MCSKYMACLSCNQHYQRKFLWKTHNSSIACCVGRGSSSPRAIISQETEGSNPGVTSGIALAAGETLSLLPLPLLDVS